MTYSSTNLVHDKLLSYEEVETPPALDIAPVSDGQVTVSWNPDVPIWLLQQMPELQSPSWSNAPSGPTNPVTVPAPESGMFFRLGL